MARSYRAPIYTCGYGGTYRRFVKRQAAKIVRQSDLVSNFAYYKRLYNSYNIVDYKWRVPKTDVIWYDKAKRK